MKRLIGVVIVGTFVISAYAHEYTTEYDGYDWVQYSYEQKIDIMLGYKMAIWAYDQELTVFWDINTGNLIERWRDKTLAEHVWLTDDYYKRTGDYERPLWQVIFSQGRDDYIYEFDNREYRN